MEDEFYQLVNVREIKGAATFTIPRAKALVGAVTRHRDFPVLQLLVRAYGEKVEFECIVVDVECDGVPPKNPYGIHYRERLALCVFDDPKRLVEVHALRKGFPILLHQNQSPQGSANRGWRQDWTTLLWSFFCTYQLFARRARTPNE